MHVYYLCMHIHTYIQTYIHTYIYACIYIWYIHMIHTYIHTLTNLGVIRALKQCLYLMWSHHNTCSYICMYTCVCIYIFSCIRRNYPWCGLITTHVHIYIYIYAHIYVEMSHDVLSSQNMFIYTCVCECMYVHIYT